MKNILFILLSIVPIFGFSQEEEKEDFQVNDSLYREDQVYVGVTFNLLPNGPASFSQNGLSAGFQLGFIRDFPFNKRRNKALGIGLGLSVDTYNHNLFIGEDVNDQKSIYNIIGSNIDPEDNRFTYYTLEIPLEYRWRTSTSTKYSFWRVHVGAKLGYIFRFKSTFIDNGATISRSNIPEINKLQYGPSFSFGYGAFNFQAYYGLNTLFNDDARIEDENVNLRVIRLGLIFYFL